MKQKDDENDNKEEEPGHARIPVIPLYKSAADE
jgi:hypothetical protein